MEDWITKIANKHDYWVRIINSYGESLYAEDIVQELYIRLYKYATEDKVLIDGEVNYSYVSFVLRNLFYDYCKKKKQVELVRIGEGYNTPANKEYSYMEQTQADEAILRINDKINNHIKKWHWYDGHLYDLHINKGMSMRSISRGAGISLKNICETMKRCRKDMEQFMSDEVQQDIDNYKEGNYELV